MYYVRMTDRFMSGWGLAEGKTNVFVVACPDYEAARNVFRHAITRNEMCRVRIVDAKPRARPGVLYSLKNYTELGPIWKGA